MKRQILACAGVFAVALAAIVPTPAFAADGSEDDAGIQTLLEQAEPAASEAPAEDAGPAASGVDLEQQASEIEPQASELELSATSFRDVPASHPFYGDIMWLAQTGIATGWPDGTFRPSASVTRDAFAAFLYRAAGSPQYTPPAASPFRDISPSHPFYKEIAWAAASGITRGWSDGTFRPLQPIARDAIAAFLYRAAGTPGYSASKDFRDIGCSEHRTAIRWLGSAGISTGWADGTYRPDNPTERAAIAAFLHRFRSGHSVVASPARPASATVDPVSQECIDARRVSGRSTYSSATGQFWMPIDWVGQSTNYYCGPASLEMVLRYKGATRSVRGEALSQRVLANGYYTNADGWHLGRHGTSWEEARLSLAANRWMGANVYVNHSSPSAAQLRAAVVNSFKKDAPVIVDTVQVAGSWTFNNHGNWGTASHIVVVTGYNEKTDTATFLDPLPGRGSRQFTYNLGQFAERFLQSGVLDGHGMVY